MANLRLGIDVNHIAQTVVLSFERKTNWIEFDAKTGVELAETIIKKADTLTIETSYESPIQVNVEADATRRVVIIALTEMVDWVDFNKRDALRLADAVVRKSMKAIGEDPDAPSLILPMGIH